MRLAGFLLLLAGWGIVLAAVIVLGAGVPRGAFVFSGLGVEILGFVVIMRSYPLPRSGRG